MDKKSAMMKPEKKGARPKEMMEQKIEDVLASKEGQEGKEQDETEAMM